MGTYTLWCTAKHVYINRQVEMWTCSLSDKHSPYLAHSCHSWVEHLSSSPLRLLSALSEEHVYFIILWVISFRQWRYPHKLGIWKQTQKKWGCATALKGRYACKEHTRRVDRETGWLRWSRVFMEKINQHLSCFQQLTLKHRADKTPAGHISWIQQIIFSFSFSLAKTTEKVSHASPCKTENNLIDLKFFRNLSDGEIALKDKTAKTWRIYTMKKSIFWAFIIFIHHKKTSKAVFWSIHACFICIPQITSALNTSPSQPTKARRFSRADVGMHFANFTHNCVYFLQ